MRDSVADTIVPHREMFLFASPLGNHVYLADGSRIFDIDGATADRIRRWTSDVATEGIDGLLQEFGLDRPQNRRIAPDQPLELPPVRSLSLNIAQACNMSCNYCYADKGHFKSPPKMMGEHVMRDAVDRLIDDCPEGERIVLGFIGGEPLLARKLMHAVVAHAEQRAAQRRIRVGYSLTTNGTLITAEDARLWHAHDFAVTISADGNRERHRAVRPMNNGADSYAAMLDGLECIEKVGRPRQLSARATVVAGQGRLVPLLDNLLSLGFDDVGFSPVLVSPDPRQAFTVHEFEGFLAAMIECGDKALGEIRAGRSYAFANLETALQEIHRGTHRPLPCGAAAGYLSVGADGRLYACHRLIGDERFRMGSLAQGTDDNARRALLARSHVDRVAPCRECWARYLCGGGCHHETGARGRIACDYIRGWLEFCLRAYVELSAHATGADVEPAHVRTQ